MATSVIPAPAGTAAVPANAAPMDDVAGDAPTTHVVPPEPGTPSNIFDAGKAYREKLEREALAADAPTDPATPSTEQPRNPDGTFASKTPAVDAASDAPASEADAGSETPAAESESAAGEAKVFVLKGEAQRGEPDIELDASGLPPEVIERLERNQKQGMRRAEYDTAMGKVRQLQADQDEVETMIGMDPQGFVLDHVAPAHRPELAATLLFEHWDELAPLIQQYWEDPAGRLRTQQQIREGIAGRKSTVQQQIVQSRGVRAVKNAVAALVPETAADDVAQEFTNTALAILGSRNQVIDPAQVPDLLAGHVRRYFGAAPAPAPETPAKPKLAVKSTPSATPAKAPVPPKTVAQQIQGRNAARVVAPQGAGPAAVQRPGPPANASVQEASKWWRAQKGA